MPFWEPKRLNGPFPILALRAATKKSRLPLSKKRTQNSPLLGDVSHKNPVILRRPGVDRTPTALGLRLRRIRSDAHAEVRVESEHRDVTKQKLDLQVRVGP